MIQIERTRRGLIVWTRWGYLAVQWKWSRAKIYRLAGERWLRVWGPFSLAYDPEDKG